MNKNEDSTQNHFCASAETACSFLQSLPYCLFSQSYRERREQIGKRSKQG